MVDPVKWLVSSAVACFLLHERNGMWFSIVIGALVNAVAVKLLKRLLRMPRPATTDKIDPGMPSSHAHMLGFFAALALCLRPALPEIGGGLGAFAVLVSWHRVRIKEIHTAAQCLVGLGTGALGAVLWAGLAHNALAGWLDDRVLLMATTTTTTEQQVVLLLLLVCVFTGAGLVGRFGRTLSGTATTPSM